MTIILCKKHADELQDDAVTEFSPGCEPGPEWVGGTGRTIYCDATLPGAQAKLDEFKVTVARHRRNTEPARRAARGKGREPLL